MNIFDDKIPTDPVIEQYKKDVDVGLIRENLKLTVTERILKLQEHLTFAEGLQQAGRTMRAKSRDEI